MWGGQAGAPVCPQRAMPWAGHLVTRGTSCDPWSRPGRALG